MNYYYPYDQNVTDPEHCVNPILRIRFVWLLVNLYVLFIINLLSIDFTKVLCDIYVDMHYHRKGFRKNLHLYFKGTVVRV